MINVPPSPNYPFCGRHKKWMCKLCDFVATVQTLMCCCMLQHLGNLSLVHFIQWNKSTMVKIYFVQKIYWNTLKYTILARLFTINYWFLFPGIFCAFMNWCNLLNKCTFVRKSFVPYFTVEIFIHELMLLFNYFWRKAFAKCFQYEWCLSLIWWFNEIVQVILESNFIFFSFFHELMTYV